MRPIPGSYGARRRVSQVLGLGLLVVGSAERLAEIGEDVSNALAIVSVLCVAVIHTRE